LVARRSVLAGVGAICLAGALGRGAAAERKLDVVATFSILADVTANIGGDRIALTTLVPPGGDAHVYAPTPADARAAAAAKLVIANGLGFEGWLGRLLQSSASRAVLVEAAGKAPADGRASAGATDRHGHDHGGVDPHAWQSVANVKLYVGGIRDALIAADPLGAEGYRANAARYLAELDALDAEIRAAVTSIPVDRRKIITSHDAFGHFARAYGVAFIAPRGVSTESEASARDVARIIQQIRREKIPAVFLENVSDQRLMQQIARDTGARIGGALYSDSLSGPEGPAPTYIRMMRHNIRTIAAALAPAS